MDLLKHYVELLPFGGDGDEEMTEKKNNVTTSKTNYDTNPVYSMPD